MGCDIHVMTEIKKKYNNPELPEEWVNVDNFRFNEYYGKFEEEQEYHIRPIFTDRNYELFSFLADVRNYGGNESFGFDRGFPEDAHRITRTEFEAWDCDAHTPGYCTLKELKEAVQKVARVRREGAVTKEAAEQYRATGAKPTMWSQGVGQWEGIAPKFQDKYEWLVWEVEVHCFDRLLAAIEERKRDAFWIFGEDDGSHDDEIRIVFWFDN